MANIYEVHHTNGQTYEVPTDRHHDDHSDYDFKKHLLTILEGIVSGVATGHIMHYRFKGRR